MDLMVDEGPLVELKATEGPASLHLAQVPFVPEGEQTDVGTAH